MKVRELSELKAAIEVAEHILTRLQRGEFWDAHAEMVKVIERFGFICTGGVAFGVPFTAVEPRPDTEYGAMIRFIEIFTRN